MTQLISIALDADAPLSDASWDDALALWWNALLEHAASRADADWLIADAWAETGRLIGSVQRVDEPVGTDRGVRVALTARSIATAVSESGAAREVVVAARESLFRAFERSRKRLVSEDRFASLWGGRVGCYYCEDGAVIAEPSLRPRPERSPRPRSRAR